MKQNSELERLQVLKLLQCVQQNDYLNIKKLCDKGVVGILNYVDLNSGKTALIKAIELNNEKLVGDLILLGADPNVGDLNDKTPIMYACELGLHVVVEELCKLKVDLNIIDKADNTALSYCLSSSTNRHLRCLDVLLDFKNAAADVNLERRNNGTVFLEACKKNMELQALLLFKKGANIDVRDKETNNHALHFAAQNNMLNVCYTLLLNQIDPNVVNFDLQTPLIIAAKNGHLRILKLLFALGANFDAIDAFGFNAIFYAVSRKSPLLVKYLTSRGTNPKYKNPEKLTPRKLARIVKLRFAGRLFKKLKKLHDDWLTKYVTSAATNNYMTSLSVDLFGEIFFWLLRIHDFIDAKKERLGNLLNENASIQNKSFIGKDSLMTVFRKYMSTEIPDRVFEELFKVFKMNNENEIEISTILTPKSLSKTLNIKLQTKKKRKKKKKAKRKLKIHYIRGKTKVRIAIPAKRVTDDAKLFQKIRLRVIDDQFDEHKICLKDDGRWYTKTHETINVELANLINSGNLESFKDLIERQVRAEDKKKLINLKDRYYKTPLIIAVIKNDLRMVDYLLENKADVNLFDNFKWTPIHHAAFNGNIKIVSQLIKHGANLNARTISGSTPLIMAIKANHEQMARLLLKHKVKLIDPSNVNKASPLEVARKFALHTPLYSLIEENSKKLKKTTKPIVPKRHKRRTKLTKEMNTEKKLRPVKIPDISYNFKLLQPDNNLYLQQKSTPDCAKIKLPLKMPNEASIETLLEVKRKNRLIHGYEYDFPDYKTPFQRNIVRIQNKK